MTCADCRDALNAYVDGELMPDEAQDIRDHLSTCGDCAAEHEVLMTVSRRLKAGLQRPRAPDILRARIRSAIAQPDAFSEVTPRRERLALPALIAAAAIVAVLGSLASFAVGRRMAATPPVVEQVLASHIRSLMPGHLTDVASSDLHNVKPWFNGRVDLSPSVPRLDSAGFPLVGGRLDYVGGRPVAAVVYSRRQHLINVFSWPAADAHDARAVVSTEHGYHLVHWSAAGVDYWAASDLGLPELNQFVALFASR